MNVVGQGVPPVQHLRTPKAGQAGRPVLPRRFMGSLQANVARIAPHEPQERGVYAASVR